MIEEKRIPYLTTIDNVYNPFTHFDEWLSFDKVYQHFSNETLARQARVSDRLSDEENRQELERAIDRIIELDPTHTFVKVYKDSYNSDMDNARKAYTAWYNSIKKINPAV